MSTEPKSVSTQTYPSKQGWQACFEAVIDYYAGCIDDEIPAHKRAMGTEGDATTPREYYNDRGWTDDTIEKKRLGWAPVGHKNTLLAELKDDGYTDEEIRATGLFSEELIPCWQGRYVFPYFNQNGRPIYAISRATAGDIDSPKYLKIAHKKYVDSTEPIYGLGTLREGEPVVITEGIADAITIHQEGHPCLSPVTTRFKKSECKSLLEALESKNVSRVYVIQDNERPKVNLTDNEKLQTNQFGPGIQGAIETATFLTDHGIDARVNTPPAHGFDKVDVDDYIREGLGEFEALIRSAKPARQHPAFTESQTPDTEIEQDTRSPVRSGSSNESGLFSLSIIDVTGCKPGFRGRNPLGHFGNSEIYFVINDDEWAFDHKRGVSYYPLTYLLCEAGARSVDYPGGQLTDEEYFVAWRYAKESGILPTDDPIPHRARIHIAIEHELCEQEDLDGDLLPADILPTDLEIVRDEYGLNPGRGILTSKSDSKVLSQSMIGLADSLNGPEITLDDARHKCTETIEKALSENDYSVIDALPAQGKSRGVVKWAARTDSPLTVLTPRRKLHEQYEEWCDESGLTTYQLPSFHRDCECAAGKHGKELKNRVQALYDANVSGHDIHRYAEECFGQKLPCMEHGQCSYFSKSNFDSGKYDVLLGDYRHAYSNRMTEDRTVAIDESPTSGYLKKFAPETVRSSVSAYLQDEGELPFSNYTDLIENRSDPYRSDDAIAWFRENEPEVGEQGRAVMKDSSKQTNAYAPLMTYALLTGRELGNGWEHSELPDGQLAARNRDPDTENGEDELIFLHPPNLDQAENVIGLDGTPCIEQWELCLGHSVEQCRVLDDPQRASYLRYGLNLSIHQMSEAAHPYASGNWVDPDRDTALIKQIGERERQLPDLITSQKAIAQYDSVEAMDFVNESKYWGNLIGSNGFGGSRLGLVIGSPHYGDTYLNMWGAFANESIKRLDDGRGMDLDYGQFGNKLLHEMREGTVLQSLMRFGRDGDGATIYVYTGAIPEWVPLAGKGSLKKLPDGMRSVVNVVREQVEWRTSDLVEEIPERSTPALVTKSGDKLSQRRVQDRLGDLYEWGFLDRRKEGNGWIWENKGVGEIDDKYHVIFESQDH